MNSRQNQLQAFERLLDIMDDLRENVRGIKANHANVASSYHKPMNWVMPFWTMI
jgi:hypothetical protein